MSNWESEANRALSQEKSEINSRLEQKGLLNLERKNQVTRIIKSSYEQFLLPGYEILDRYKVKESLIEIRDQLWGGEVKKETESCEQYLASVNKSIAGNFTLMSEIYLSPDQLDDKNYLSQASLSNKAISGIVNESSLFTAKYILIKPEVICRFAGYDSTSWDSGGTYDNLSVCPETLKVSSRNNIDIYDEIGGNWHTLENLEALKPDEIKKWIHDNLLQVCTNFKKRREDASTHSSFQDYLKKITPIPQKRSFLDRLFDR